MYGRGWPAENEENQKTHSCFLSKQFRALFVNHWTLAWHTFGLWQMPSTLGLSRVTPSDFGADHRTLAWPSDKHDIGVKIVCVTYLFKQTICSLKTSDWCDKEKNPLNLQLILFKYFRVVPLFFFYKTASYLKRGFRLKHLRTRQHWDDSATTFTFDLKNSRSLQTRYS